jgi:hypothetical protein
MYMKIEYYIINLNLHTLKMINLKQIRINEHLSIYLTSLL